MGTTHGIFGLNLSLAAEWYRGQFFAAGNFSSMGWKPIEHVARYDGSDWLAVGDGVSHRISDESYIFALRVMGDKLYAGGIIDGLEANPGVAQWDGTNWTYLGNSPVYSGTTRVLSTDGTNLYSGGRFNSMNGVAATNIARWDGTNWHALGYGLNGEVAAIACVGNKVYAGGSFTKAGELLVPGIAVWDGSKWSGLGAGLNGTTNDPVRQPEVKHLLAYGKDLLVSGYFTGAGDVPSKGFAIWHPDGRPELNMTRAGDRIQLSWSSDQTNAVLEVSDSMSAADWLSLGSTGFGTNRFEANLTSTNRFFRLRQAP
jgi:hypothetical protein